MLQSRTTAPALHAGQGHLEQGEHGVWLRLLVRGAMRPSAPCSARAWQGMLPTCCFRVHHGGSKDTPSDKPALFVNKHGNIWAPGSPAGTSPTTTCSSPPPGARPRSSSRASTPRTCPPSERSGSRNSSSRQGRAACAPAVQARWASVQRLPPAAGRLGCTNPCLLPWCAIATFDVG